MKTKRTTIVLLFVIVLLGAFARFFALTDKSVWYGEATTINIALSDLTFRNFFDTVFSYKPLFLFLLKGWISVFGIGVFWVRLLPVIFSVISIIVIYLLGKELTGKKEGLLAAFLLSISCFHIYLSQQARHFSLMVLLTLMSYLFLIKFVKSRRTSSCFINTICNIMIVFTHPTGLVIIFAQLFLMLFLYFKEKVGFRKWFLAQSFTGFFILAWFIIANKKQMFYNIWWIPSPQLKTLIETFQTFAYGGPRYGLDDLFQTFHYPQINIFLYIIFIVFFIRGFCFVPEGAKYAFKHSRALLSSWMFYPILISLAVSFFHPVFLKKHLLVTLPAFLLITSIGIFALRKKILIFIILVLIFVLNIYPLKVMYTTDLNVDWRSAGSFLRNKAASGDMIVISTLPEINPFLYHFTSQNIQELKYVEDYGNFKSGKLDSVFMIGNNLIVAIAPNEGQGTQFVIEDFNKKEEDLNSRKGSGNIWFAASRWGDESAHAYIIEVFQKKYKQIGKYYFSGLIVYQFGSK